MRIVDHRFHKALLCYGTPDNVHQYMTYTYESSNALYDIIDAAGTLVYRMNMRTVEPLPHHELIKKHFGL